jgi:membrane-associated phospholipid phosphatase
MDFLPSDTNFSFNQYSFYDKLKLVIKKFSPSIFLILFSCSLFAQGGDSLDHKVYKVRLGIDVPLTAVGIGTSLWGLATINNKSPLDSLTIIALDANDINRFDRSATWQDAEFAPTARRLSDLTLALSNMLPFMLMLDKKIRQDWGDVLLLFLETQAIVGNLNTWGCIVNVDRIRPLVYNEDVAWAERSGTRTKNAFYSGHTSLSASASFFAAKVYCDYHPELENKKYLVYSLALVLPVTTGILRYKGMKHFPTDVLTGLLVGASTGILIPHLHKRTRSNLSIVPFAGAVNGLAMSYNF